MESPVKGFCEEIGNIGLIRKVDNIDVFLVNTIPDKMGLDIDMLHLRVAVGIVGTGNSSLVVGRV